MPKKILVALPEGMLKELDFIANDEHRSRSDAIRESIRRYANNYRKNKISATPKLTLDKEISEELQET